MLRIRVRMCQGVVPGDFMKYLRLSAQSEPAQSSGKGGKDAMRRGQLVL
jgi:hypothetical protein